MNIISKNQTKLYHIDKLFDEIVNLFKNDKLPSKILLSGPKGSGKSTMAYHLINYFFSLNESKSYDLNEKKINIVNKSFKLIQNNSHPNFHLIDIMEEKKFIEISQIRNMISFTNKSSFNNSPRFILIDNVEFLNMNSSNALLKIIEEPNENIFFILISNSNKKILSTLKSRCHNFNINLSFNETIKITNDLLNDDILNLINIDLINYYFTPGNYINLINFANENKLDLRDYNLKSFLSYLIENNFFKKNNFIKNNIFHFIELYFLKIFHYTENKNSVINLYTSFMNKINDTNKFNLDQDSLFIEFKSKILNG